jgi:hypothetical protein
LIGGGGRERKERWEAGMEVGERTYSNGCAELADSSAERKIKAAVCILSLIKYIDQLIINKIEKRVDEDREVFRKERKECRGLALKTVRWIKV